MFAHDIRLFWVAPLVLPDSSLIMAGKKGCSGGYRPGAGRPAGATAIKKTGKANAKKKKVVARKRKSTIPFLKLK